jgi:hypothetical protein
MAESGNTIFLHLTNWTEVKGVTGTITGDNSYKPYFIRIMHPKTLNFTRMLDGRKNPKV